MGEGFLIKVGKLCDLLAGDHQHMAVVDRLVGAEGNADVVGPGKTARDVSSNDFSEDTHTSILRVALRDRTRRGVARHILGLSGLSLTLNGQGIGPTTGLIC